VAIAIFFDDEIDCNPATALFFEKTKVLAARPQMSHLTRAYRTKDLVKS
jgi:hypothetical protein